MMQGSTIDEVADGIFRVSTFLSKLAKPAGLTCNQFVVLADEPILFHTGPSATYASVAEAVARVVPLIRLRWLAFGHIEADECGAMSQFLAAAPHARVAFATCLDVLAAVDLSGAARTGTTESESLDLGGRRLRRVPTPHAPHNSEAQVLYEEVTQTLFCGDLFAQLGPGPAVIRDTAIVERAIDAESTLHSASPGPTVPRTLRQLAGLEPDVLATMHGASFEGDGGTALRSLADEWEARSNSY